MNQPQPVNLRWGRGSLLVAVVALVLLFSARCWFTFKRQTLEEYASFSRPDGNYQVIELRRSTWRSLMPGQASDSPGKVQVYDRNRKLLYEADVEMVQLVESVD